MKRSKQVSDETGPDAELMRQAWEARAGADPLYAIDARRRTWEMEDFYSQGPGLVTEIVDPVLTILGVDPSEGRVLEVGCGMGRLFDGLAQRFKEVWGTDISATMIALGREHCPVEATWLLGDGTSLTGVQDESVDHVVCYEVFEHIPRPVIIRSYLNEFRRVLKPGGTFQAQLRSGSDSTRQSIVRGMPRLVRVGSGALLRKVGVLPVQGDIDTWLGSLVPPEDGLEMVQAVGFIDVAVFTALFNVSPERVSPCYWIVGRKPHEVRASGSQ
jgi:2-polyprenyl-3-methyl-5-hydroxy-6-metoxy-1,4-benzoquinol methylase